MANRVISGLAVLLATVGTFGASVAPDEIEGLVAWYDARSLYSDEVKLLDGAAVKAWPDSSGNGHDLTGKLDEGYPAVFRTLRLNKLPVVELREGSSFMVSEPFDLTDHTIVLVHRTSTGTRALFSSETNDQLGIVLNAEGGRHQIRRRQETWDYNSGRALNEFSITSLSRDDAGKLYSTIDGVAQSTETQGGHALRVGRMFHIALSRAAKRDAKGMSIAELMFFDHRLDDDELASLNYYLADKYAIELAQPDVDPGAPAHQPFDWSSATVLAQLSTITEPDLNIEDGVPVFWDAPSEVKAPFRHDPAEDPTRLHCTHDSTKVRLSISLALTAAEPGAELNIVVLKNGESYLKTIELTKPVSDAPDEKRLTGKYEVGLKLDAGDFIELMVSKNAAAGKVTPTPLNCFLLATVE